MLPRPSKPFFLYGSRDALLLTFIIWVVFSYGTYGVSQLIAGSSAFINDLPLDIPAVMIVALIAYALHPIAERTSGLRPVARGTIVLVAAVVAAFAQSVINMFENRLLGVIPALDAAHLSLIRARFSRNFLAHLYMCIATGALFVFLIEARRSSELSVGRMRAETLAAEARASALSLQLNPHFLFNALNAVSSLILAQRTEQAETTVNRLAEFLRRSLQSDPGELAPLADEVATAATYLEIERLRFEDRLRVEITVPEPLGDALVPGFLVQPLVENAIKYGVARSRTPVTVRIAAAREGDRLVLTISDDAAPAPPAAKPPGLGIGLSNIRQRLANRYGEAAEVIAGRTPEGFVNRISLPLVLDHPVLSASSAAA